MSRFSALITPAVLLLWISGSGCGKKDADTQITVDDLHVREGRVFEVSRKSYSGNAIKSFANGQTYWNAEFKRGKIVTLNRWYANGTPEVTCQFTGAQLADIQLPPNGILRMLGPLLDGYFSAHYSNGQQMISATFSTGTPQALTTWLPDGSELKPLVVPTLQYEMAWINPGTFVMGSPLGEKHRNADEYQHQVTITKGFWLGRYEVTQTQWRSIMGDNPSRRRRNGAHPVDSIDWQEAMIFCGKVNEMEKQAGRVPEGYAFSLPTEAQWEYACRAGSTNAFAAPPDILSWNLENGGGSHHPVGIKQMSDWGIFDMQGNVWEWCLDAYNAYPTNAISDPYQTEGEKHILRGGSWRNRVRSCRAARRNSYFPGDSNNNIGLRLALTPVLE